MTANRERFLHQGTYSKEGAEDANQDGQEHDEQQTKGTSFVSGRLGVYCC